MELIDVEEVFCKDCEFKDNCQQIHCDVKVMPRVTPASAEWHDVYLLDREHFTMTCSVCKERITHHTFHKPFSFCPYCGAKARRKIKCI